MWKKIVEYFRALDRAELSGEVARLNLVLLGKKNTINQLEDRILELREQLKGYKEREVIDFTVGDPAPTDKEKRRAYVSAVAGLYHDYLHPKYKQMIASARKELEDQGNVRELDLQIKGVIFALWELIRWGELMQSEDKANMVGQDPSAPTDSKK